MPNPLGTPPPDIQPVYPAAVHEVFVDKKREEEGAGGDSWLAYLYYTIYHSHHKRSFRE
jgi:hypothetical protein